MFYAARKSVVSTMKSLGDLRKALSGARDDGLNVTIGVHQLSAVENLYVSAVSRTREAIPS